ncbi:MAG: peptidoglycan-associated lipoprotein Pal [Nitrospiraceae bacterium]
MDTHSRMAGLAATVGLLLVIAAGCSSKAIQTASDSSTEPGVVKEPRVAEQDLLGKSPSVPGKGRGSEEIQVAKGAPSDAGRRHAEDIRREQVATAIAGLKDVFFTFDSWNISDEARHALEVDAQWLQSNLEKVVTIEGHCDERGTQAYNLVLGEKRAKAVRNYLVELGVGTGQLTVTSYGKERPFCKEHDESCYQQNRRGHMTLRVR